MLTCPPVPRPNSAVATLVCTANSCTASVMRKLPSAELICVSMMLTPSSRNTLDRDPATLKPPPCVPVADGTTPGVSRAKSRYWRAFSGMLDMTLLSTTLLSVLLSASSSGIASELTSITSVTLPTCRAMSTWVIWSTWTRIRFSVTFLKPGDSTTRLYSAGANCRNWKPPLVSLTASTLALVAGLVSVNLAPEISEPLGSFTDPAMLPVGEAETVAVINRRMSAQAANRGPRDRHIKKTEGLFRGMSIPSQSELFFKPQAGVGQLKLARAYARWRPLSSANASFNKQKIYPKNSFFRLAVKIDFVETRSGVSEIRDPFLPIAIRSSKPPSGAPFACT